MKKYRVALGLNHTAKSEQTKDGYLYCPWQQDIALYDYAKARRKADMFGGMVEYVSGHDESELDHFADCAPTEVREKMLDIAREIESDFISDYDGGGMGKDAYGCQRLNTIYGYHISGFIPSQNGGFEVTEFYSNGESSGAYFTESEREATENDYTNMVQSFARDVLEKEWEAAQEWAEQFDYNELTSEQQNAMADYESEWFEPVLLRVEMWLDRGKDRKSESVFFRLSCNYNDAPYYRAKSDETITEFNLTIAELLEIEPQQIIERLNKAEG